MNKVCAKVMTFDLFQPVFSGVNITCWEQADHQLGLRDQSLMSGWMGGGGG